jgi:hypothetical protein
MAAQELLIVNGNKNKYLFIFKLIKKYILEKNNAKRSTEDKNRNRNQNIIFGKN